MSLESLAMQLIHPEIFHRYDYDRFSNFFNWTMTYRADSDIPTPYGRVVPKASGFSYVPDSEWEHKYDPVKASHLKDCPC